VLKKIGIVAATVTAGMLALSPLAFADDGDWSAVVKDNDKVKISHEYFSLEDDSVEREQENECSFEQDATGAGLPVVGGILPPTQAQTDNCVNNGDDDDDDAEVPAPAPAPAPASDA